MVSVFRVMVCCLWCVAYVAASGPTDVSEVKAMEAYLDNFDDLIGNDAPNQNCIGAAKGVITGGSLSKAHTGKGWWYAFDDGQSSVTTISGVTIGSSNFEDLIDTAGKFLSAKLTVSTSSKEYPTAGLGCALTTDDEYLDLSKMTALSMKIKGSGTVRVFFETEDYKGETWGFYGANITLSSSWTTESIPVADLEPGEGSTGEDWTWSHGSDAVNKFQIQTTADVESTPSDDVEISIDDILLKGMTYGDFGWETSVISLKNLRRKGNVIGINKSHITYTIAQPQRLSINLFNAMGSRVATLFNGRAEAGSHVVNLRGNMANGNYVIVLTGEQASVVQPLRIVK